MISKIKREHEKNVGKVVKVTKEDISVSPSIKPQDEPLKVARRIRELSCAKPSPSEVHNSMGTSTLEGDLYKLIDELHPKKKQETTSVLTSAKMGQDDIKEEPPDPKEHEYTRRRELGSFTKELKSKLSNHDPMSVKDFANHDEVVKDSFLLKEEPPDLPTSVSFHGKTVSWSKPFEEGGDDAAPKSKKANTAPDMKPEGDPSLNHGVTGATALADKIACSGNMEEGEKDQLATHGNFIRAQERLLMTCQGPTEAAQDLPYLPGGYLAVITFGITKEITASSQDPDPTSNTSRTTIRRPTRTYRGVTKEIYHSPHFHHLLTISSRHHIFTTFHHFLFTTISFHHLPYIPPSFITSSHLPYPPHHHYFTNPSHLSHFPYLSPSPLLHQMTLSIFIIFTIKSPHQFLPFSLHHHYFTFLINHHHYFTS